ncbi:MAG: hypothetical protein R3E95_20660 [Thiolinea sp.]
MFYHRPGGQNQFSGLSGLKPASTPALQRLQQWISENLQRPLDVQVLAEQASMSVRHFPASSARKPVCRRGVMWR